VNGGEQFDRNGITHRSGCVVLERRDTHMHRYTAYEAQVWARRQRLGGDTAGKIILMILSDYADEWGTCYPGVERIAEEGEISKSTVLRKLKALAHVGLIAIERRANDRGHRTSNRYTLEIGVTVTPAQWREAWNAVMSRVDHPAENPEEVQGVIVTPGSPPPPKCHPERGSKVSSGDTGTTSGTTSSTPLPPSGPVDEHQQGAQGVLGIVGGSAPSAPVTGPQIAFQRSWEVYPRKTSKLAAERAFLKAAKTANVEEIIAAVPVAIEQWKREQRPADKIPYPATWLNAGGWADEAPAAAAAPPSAWATAPSAADVYRETVGK
jgi:hypothetical protein